jgi:hypothetical protein
VTKNVNAISCGTIQPTGLINAHAVRHAWLNHRKDSFLLQGMISLDSELIYADLEGHLSEYN